MYAEALETDETVQRLTPEQETIARFWSDGPGETATPAWALALDRDPGAAEEEASLATAGTVGPAGV